MASAGGQKAPTAKAWSGPSSIPAAAKAIPRWPAAGFAEPWLVGPARPALEALSVTSLDDGNGIAVVIGAMKSGTSSLHEYLALHPEITMSKQKELNFFTDEGWDRGLGWYERQLEGSTKVRGESSPNYTKHPDFPGVPERMHSVLPRAKLIYLVREPVGRIVSHYVHNLSHGRERRTFGGAVKGNRGYLCPSLYMSQIEAFLKYFEREQLLVIEQEALLRQREPTLRRVFEFLEVRVDFTSPKFESSAHQTANKRRPTPLGNLAYRVPGLHSLRDVLPWPFTRPLEKPDVDDDTRHWLLQHIAPDVRALRDFTGLALEGWPDSE